MKPTKTEFAVLILGIAAAIILTTGILMFASEDSPAPAAPTNSGINYNTDPWYQTGDLVCNIPPGTCVIVTGFDISSNTYSYRDAYVDLHNGTKEGGTDIGEMGRVAFQEKYDTKVTLHK